MFAFIILMSLLSWSLHVICVISVFFCNIKKVEMFTNIWWWFVWISITIIGLHWNEHVDVAVRRWIINSNTEFWNCGKLPHSMSFYCDSHIVFYWVAIFLWNRFDLRVPCQKAKHQLPWTIFYNKLIAREKQTHTRTHSSIQSVAAQQQ